MKPTHRALAWCLILSLLLQGTGCTRRYYRKDADKEVAKLLQEKSCDPRWSLDGYYVYPNPEARFGDVSNPDKPPMPPDDHGAYELSPHPQGPYHKSGVGLVGGTGYLDRLDEWDRLNRAEQAEEERTRRERGTPGAKKDAAQEEAPAANGGNGQAPAARGSAAGGAGKAKPLAEGMTRPPDDGLGGDSGIAGELTPQQIQARAEQYTRRELIDAVTTKGPIPEKEAEKKVSQERAFLIKLDQSVELGLINSREYQTRREQLYIAALPVTLERFAFYPQLLAAGTAFRERFGRETPEGYVNRWRTTAFAGFSQAFTSGGLLLLNFANRTVFNLFNRPDVSVSTFSLDVVQPLLLGAGKAVTLEPLTQAERDLLYAIRDFAKFRQDFYVYIAAGQPAIQGVQAIPVRIPPGTLSIPSSFIPSPTPFIRPFVTNLVSPQVLPNSGFPNLSTVFLQNAPPQGYLGSLIDKATLINQYRNIEALKRFLRLFRVYLEGGLVNSVQVGQVEQQLLQSIENGLSQQTAYRSDLDQFKQQLGLPMFVRLDLDDTPLRPMFDQTRRYEEISNTYEEVSNRALQYALPDAEEVKQLRGRLRALMINSPFVRGTPFAERIGGLLDEVARIPRGAALDDRIERLQKEANALREKREQLRDKESDLPEKEMRRLEELDFQADLARYERSLRAYETRFWETEKDPARRAALQNRQFVVVYRFFLSLIEEAFRERQERVRRLWPDLPALCVDGVDLLSGDDDTVLAAVTRAALENRLDLMNQRAQLVDSWRKIRVAANALLGVLNVQYHFDVSTTPGRFEPFNFRGSTSHQQLIVDGTLPIVRIAQRNAYRMTLIAYQQQRRQLQQAEDQVLFDVRSQLRTLRSFGYNYQNVQKRAIELAFSQVDQSLQAFSQPQQPSGPALPAGAVGPPTTGGGGGGAGGGGDPAALTQQLLTAQNSLLRAQNDLYNTWIAYLTSRISIYRDMGLMQVDPRGVWIDDVATYHCSPSCASPQRPDGDKRPGGTTPAPGERPGGGPERLPAPKPVPPAEK
jgi:outer membrane protein TolC